MTVPDSDALLTYGGATQDYSPPTSVLFARKSQFVNQAWSREAGMTVTAYRAAVTFNSTGVTYAGNVWGNGYLLGNFVVSKGDPAVATTVNQSTVLSAGCSIVFNSDPATFYQIQSVSPTSITLTASYTGGSATAIAKATAGVSTSSTGIYTLTYPTIVYDDIPDSFPGASASGHLVNIRASYSGFLDNDGTHDIVARSAALTSTTVNVFVRAGDTRDLADIPDGTFVSVWVI